MNTKELLFKLCEQDFIGSVHDCAKTVESLISPYVDEIQHRTDGTVCAIKHGNDKKIMLEAHIDQIGFIVTEVFDDGFLRLQKVGGIDIRTLPASEIKIHGKEIVYGAVCSVPPHLQTSKSEKFPSIDECFVDTCLGEKLKDVVSVGDYAVYSNTPVSLMSGRVSSRSLDDRSACATLILAAESLSEKDVKSTIVYQFSQAEELGGSGAKTATFEQNVDCALACDVSFGDGEDVKPHECGKLGEGPMIGYSPSLSRHTSDIMVAVAEREKIPYQKEIMNGRTGTDADHIAITRSGVECGLVSIPLRYMHTPVETVELCDIDNTAKIMVGFVLEKDGELCD